MKTRKNIPNSTKLFLSLTTLALLLAGCSGGSSSSSSGGAVTGVATPSKVSVVNTN
jgi:hypothetical protein